MFEGLKRKSKTEKAIYIITSFIFMLVALSYMYILVWTFISGTKTHREIVMDPFGLPEVWNFKNYIEVFSKLKVNDTGFLGMLFNSVFFSVIGVGLTQFCSITFAYCTMKYQYPGSQFVYPLFIVIMTLPLYGTGGGQYLLYDKLGWINSYAQIIPAYNAMGAGTLYFMAYYSNVSNAYMEAAQIDGANNFQTYFRVMFPLAKPIFGALYLKSWIAEWNSYESTLIYLPKKPTLPVGIYQFNQEMIYTAQLDVLFAACIIVVIPALVLFIAFNKTLTTNVSLGGLKG